MFRHSSSSWQLPAMLTLIACVVGSGCSLNTIQPLKAETTSLSNTTSVVPNLNADASKSFKAYDEYAYQITNYLDHENFDLLDKIADEIRSGKTRFSGGAWKLHKLYLGLREPVNGRKATEQVWQLHIERLKKWVERKPKSITARVGLADAYVEYGWHARGTGFADTVTDEGWELLRTRVATAETILTEAEKLDAKCPHWYSVMQKVALGQSWDLDSYNKLFEDAIAFEPSYHYFYTYKATFLLPRWHGEPGDWERFADEISGRLGGKLGSIIYYIIATDLACYYKDRTFFTETSVSWPKVKQGFADLQESYGTSMYGLNELCRIAGQAGDKPFTQELLARIGNNWDPETWGNKEYFEHYKAWAASGE